MMSGCGIKVASLKFKLHVLYNYEESLLYTCCVIGDPYVSQNDKTGFLSYDELKKLLVEV